MSTRFSFTDARFIETRSRVIGSTAAPQITGVQAVTVECGCGYGFRAIEGDGSLSNVIGGVRIACPNCKHQEIVRLDEIQ